MGSVGGERGELWVGKGEDYGWEKGEGLEWENGRFKVGKGEG